MRISGAGQKIELDWHRHVFYRGARLGDPPAYTRPSPAA